MSRENINFHWKSKAVAIYKCKFSLTNEIDRFDTSLTDFKFHSEGWTHGCMYVFDSIIWITIEINFDLWP